MLSWRRLNPEILSPEQGLLTLQAILAPAKEEKLFMEGVYFYGTRLE